MSDSCRVHCFEAAAHSCCVDLSPSLSPFWRPSAPTFLYLKIGWCYLLDPVDGVQNSRTSGHGEMRAHQQFPPQRCHLWAFEDLCDSSVEPGFAESLLCLQLPALSASNPLASLYASMTVFGCLTSTHARKSSDSPKLNICREYSGCQF